MILTRRESEAIDVFVEPPFRAELAGLKHGATPEIRTALSKLFHIPRSLKNMESPVQNYFVKNDIIQNCY